VGIDGLFDFRGRLSRLGFWRAWLDVQVFGLLGWALSIFATIEGGRLGALVLAPTVVLYATALASCLVRRLHDRNRSGWQLIPLVAGPLLARVAADPLIHSSRPALAWIGAAIAFLALAANLWTVNEIGVQDSAPAGACSMCPGDHLAHRLDHHVRPVEHDHVA
jgi:uncharacterized membrane protein YhaH (DUF805 family)